MLFVAGGIPSHSAAFCLVDTCFSALNSSHTAIEIVGQKQLTFSGAADLYNLERPHPVGRHTSSPFKNR